MNTIDFIKKASIVHNGKYDYSKTVYTNPRNKVIITCPKHGDFMVLPYAHLSGNGCRKCYYEKLSERKKITKEEFIEKAKKVHGDKYDYSKVDYLGINEPVTIICSKHGEFSQKPFNHLNGCGCQECGKEKIWDKRGRITTEEFIKNAKLVHGNKYDYSKAVYKNNREKVCIICHKKRRDGTEHGEFWQKPNDHLCGKGCPNCRNSYLERKLSTALSKDGIKYIQEKTFEWLVNEKGFHLYYDFFLPDKNIAIECQGIQHFIPLKENVKKYNSVVKKDKKKKELSDKHSIKLIYFSEKCIIEKYRTLNNMFYNENDVIKEIKNA